MKKQRISIAVLAIMLILGLTSITQAHNVEELDPKSYIYMPFSIINAKGSITISSSVGSNYTLSYQKVDISNASYTQLQNKSKELEEYSDAEKAKLATEKANVDTLKSQYDSLPTDATQEQRDVAYEAYRTAVEAYNTHVQEVNTKIKEYNNTIKQLIPSYQDNKWTVASKENNNVQLDFTDYSGEIHFALWAKLVVGSETYYDVQCYTSTVTSKTTITLDKETATVEATKTLKLTATTNSDKTVQWSSSKEEVATVDQNGNITAKAEGITVITATVEGKSATCTVTVTKSTENKENENKPDGDTSDFSNAKFTYHSETLRNLKIEINQYKTKKDYTYYLYISKNKQETIDSIPTKGDQLSIISIKKDGVAEAILVNEAASKILEQAGTNYMYIIEVNKMDSSRTLLVKAKEMPSIPLPNLGLRLDIFLYDAKKTIVMNKVEIEKNRKINYKIGKITSEDILRAFKNEASTTAFAKLLEYAKREKAMATGSVTEAGLDYNLVNKLNIEKDAYYFIYMVADTENGKYNELEDVAIYRENNEKEGNALVHFDFATIDVKDKVVDNTTATGSIPQTGISYIVGITVVSSLLVGGVIANKQYKKYKEIK